MKSLRFVSKYVRKYAGWLALTVVSMVLLVGVQLLAPWIVRRMVAAITDPVAGPEAVGLIARLALIALAVYGERARPQPAGNAPPPPASLPAATAANMAEPKAPAWSVPATLISRPVTLRLEAVMTPGQGWIE